MANVRNASIDIAKGLAIISVVFAHCNGVYVTAGLPWIGSLILQHIGTWGVLVFFYLSGVLYQPGGGKNSPSSAEKDTQARFAMAIQRNYGISVCLSAEAPREFVRLRGVSSGEWLLPVLSDNACMHVSDI